MIRAIGYPYTAFADCVSAMHDSAHLAAENGALSLSAAIRNCVNESPSLHLQRVCSGISSNGCTALTLGHALSHRPSFDNMQCDIGNFTISIVAHHETHAFLHGIG
jgi:hypothetical protein